MADSGLELKRGGGGFVLLALLDFPQSFCDFFFFFYPKIRGDPGPLGPSPRSAIPSRTILSTIFEHLRLSGGLGFSHDVNKI